MACSRAFRQVEIGDGDDLEAFALQVVHHALRTFGKALAIYGEGAIVLLVIDVEINDVGGNLAFAKFRGDLRDSRFRIVAITALLISQRE